MNEWYKHLDGCKQCRTQPFNLCPIGAELLQRAALDNDTAPRPIECEYCRRGSFHTRCKPYDKTPDK